MDEAQLEAFLAKPRQAILLTTRADGSAHGVPVWFDWDGEFVRFFSGADAPKMRRLARDPRLSMLISNDIDEPPMWVCFEGEAEVAPDEDARHLATEVLAPRYWDLTTPGYASTVEAWRSTNQSTSAISTAASVDAAKR